ncbi:MAG: hypothetical protein ACTSYA_01990 [Candidatus Kariarchaeaceae archaeon]
MNYKTRFISTRDKLRINPLEIDMVVIIKKLSSLIFSSLLIILVLSIPVHAELVTFERTISGDSDVTFDFEVNYDKYLANNAQTTVSITITLPSYPPSLTDCRLTAVGLTLADLGNPGNPIVTESLSKANDFLEPSTSEFTFSLSFTPEARLDEAPNGYFPDSIITLNFFIVLGFNSEAGSAKIVYSPGLALATPTEASTSDPTTDPTTNPSTSDESFFDKNGPLITAGVIVVVIIGLFVLLTKSTPYEPTISTQSQEFSKKRSTEKKSRRDRKKRN